MCCNEDCSSWEELYAQAQEEAQRHLPTTTAAWDKIRQVLNRAKETLRGEDVRNHSINFDPDAWPLSDMSLPQQILGKRRVSRGDVIDVAAEPVDASTNWRLFCMSFVFGYGLSELGPARFRRIIRRTTPEQISAIVGEARQRLNTCGSLAAYDYLRYSDWRGRVPVWGPAFFTKLLYFANTSGEGLIALILDHQMARIVRRLSGIRYLVTGGRNYRRWTAYRYGVYLAWMHLVAEELDVRADFLEYALFTQGR
jgi:hypothetical protein